MVFKSVISNNFVTKIKTYVFSECSINKHTLYISLKRLFNIRYSSSIILYISLSHQLNINIFICQQVYLLVNLVRSLILENVSTHFNNFVFIVLSEFSYRKPNYRNIIPRNVYCEQISTRKIWQFYCSKLREAFGECWSKNSTCMVS